MYHKKNYRLSKLAWFSSAKQRLKKNYLILKQHFWRYYFEMRRLAPEYYQRVRRLAPRYYLEAVQKLRQYYFSISRPMRKMLISLLILFTLIFAYKLFKGYMIYRHMMASFQPPTVSTLKVAYEPWQSSLKASCSLRAVQGINITSEVAGLVRTVHFTPGASVNKNDMLIELNNDSEVAQLRSLEAMAELAKISYKRNKDQFAVKAVSKAALDVDEAEVKNKEAQIASQNAIVAKKSLRAPFAGRLGISQVNPGQYVNPGDKLVTLQALDPIYVNFNIPQRMLNQVKKDLIVTVTVDAYPDQSFTGKITTINPIVDTRTRNVQVEATLANTEAKLLPGMFGKAQVTTGPVQNLLTVPQAAISFNPYGEVLYLIKEEGKDRKGKPNLIARQSFVKVGEKRGDQIAVLEGLKEGDVVVTSGQLKLRNGNPVMINNAVLPANEVLPKPVDE